MIFLQSKIVLKPYVLPMGEYLDAVSRSKDQKPNTVIQHASRSLKFAFLMRSEGWELGG
jgi:hypothetical protein